MKTRRVKMATNSVMFLAAILVGLPLVASAQGNGPTLTPIYSFPQTLQSGIGPNGVVVGKDGVLYGTTQYGGANADDWTAGYGTVFSLTPPASPGGDWTEATLYSFLGGGAGDGESPYSGLAVGNDGVLYGTTTYGGTGPGFMAGTVYSLAPPTAPGGQWTETVLHTFRGGADDGSVPRVGVVIGKGGVLYGTTGGGGTTDGGVVYSLTPPPSPGGEWTEAVLYGFLSRGGSDGGGYPSGLVIGEDGVLYGTTNIGGTGHGSVFELAPPTTENGRWIEATIFKFEKCGSEGCNPQGGVVIGSGGVLYGVTETGGDDAAGTVFSLAPPTSPGGAWTETVLYSFPEVTSGDYAWDQFPTGVVIGKGGALYGTTSEGGTAERGTVFSLAPSASPGGMWTETTLATFTGPNGAGPFWAGVIGSGGVLYGATLYGGLYGYGTVFQVTP